uniref:YEATS domain-containing protein n=1 Tax=Asterionellopsis glacialis TaxID=33640 RepID=A0A7S0KX24_9STRA|mmetsp:Transcript_1324/g.1843  ORF Transcript_1324/g.1843 Transcript_1324/m.1843 type:complete len:181 (+) Transcript_1324:155-697(+)
MTAANKRASTKKVDDSKKDHQQSTTPTPTEGGTTTNSSNADAMSTITSTAQNSTSGGGGPNNTTTTSNNNGNDPLEKTTACVPLVYGSMAFYLGKKADEYSTHRWTLYLRGPNNEDLSTCVAKAIFQLHPSFAQPVRELTTPPFEVTEKGWGEFEAQIKIVWKDPKEKPTLVSGMNVFLI